MSCVSCLCFHFGEQGFRLTLAHIHMHYLILFYAIHNFHSFYHFTLDFIRYACQLIIKRIRMYVHVCMYYSNVALELVWHEQIFEQ